MRYFVFYLFAAANAQGGGLLNGLRSMLPGATDGAAAATAPLNSAAASGPGGGVGAPAMPDDLGCFDGPRAATWKSAKKSFRGLFGEEGPDPFGVADQTALIAVHAKALEELNAVKALDPKVDECGEGKLFVSMLSIFRADQPAALLQAVITVEALSSPVLTLLLDIPWVGTAQAGWPFFGILAQLNTRLLKSDEYANQPELDGIETPATKKYFQVLSTVLPSVDLMAIAGASQNYLEAEKPQEGNAFAFLTAMAGQAAVLPVKERLEVLQSMQAIFKQVVGGPEQLLPMLTTRWPLWSLMHAAITPITAA